MCLDACRGQNRVLYHPLDVDFQAVPSQYGSRGQNSGSLEEQQLLITLSISLAPNTPESWRWVLCASRMEGIGARSFPGHLLSLPSYTPTSSIIRFVPKSDKQRVPSELPSLVWRRNLSLTPHIAIECSPYTRHCFTWVASPWSPLRH